MGTAEFKITTDLAPLKSFVIESNFEEVKAWLEQNLEPYKNMAVREEDIPVAKTYRATIRKVKANLDESRKTAKAAALAAYEPFEKKCKVLTGLCDDAASALDTQIKNYENAKKEEKITSLRMYFDTNIDERLKDYLKFEDIYDSKWGNATVAVESAQKDIAEAIMRCKADVDTIRSLESEFETTLLDFYSRTHDITETIRRNSELTKRKQLEAQREAEARRIAEERLTEQQKARKSQQTAQQIPTQSQQKEEPTVELDFRVWLTKTQMGLLKRFLIENKIKYGRVPHDGD